MKKMGPRILEFIVGRRRKRRASRHCHDAHFFLSMRARRNANRPQNYTRNRTLITPIRPASSIAMRAYLPKALRGDEPVLAVADLLLVALDEADSSGLLVLGEAELGLLLNQLVGLGCVSYKL